MTEIKISPNKGPLPVEQMMKLKIFGIVSLKKDKKQYVGDKDLFLTLAAAYDYSSAYFAASEGLKQKEIAQEEYIIPHIVLMRDVDQIVIGGVPQVATPDTKLESQAEKSAQELGNYVKYVFETVGTPEEKKIADKVIVKFINEKTKRGR